MVGAAMWGVAMRYVVEHAPVMNACNQGDEGSLCLGQLRQRRRLTARKGVLYICFTKPLE